MNQRQDSFTQKDVSFPPFQDVPPACFNVEEHLWQKALALHPRKNRFPYDATLLLGLIGALGFLIYKLFNLDPNNEQSFINIITRGFPWALGISGLFMFLGFFQRLYLNWNENKVEKTYGDLLSQYMKHQSMENRTSSSNILKENLTEILDNHFLVLTDTINTNFIGLTRTINKLGTEMADYSGKEIESTLHEFSKSIHGLPEQLSLALERKLEEPQKERIDFRQAVSGLLSLPVDLSELNKTLVANSNRLGEAAKSSSFAIKDIANLADKFDETTEYFSKTTKVLNTAVENLRDVLRNMGETAEHLEVSRKEIASDMRQAIEEMDSNAEQSIKKIAYISNDAATKFTTSIEHFQTNLENTAHQIKIEDRNQIEFITKVIQDSLESLKTETGSLRGSQIQVCQMIEKAAIDSGRDTKEVVSEITNSIKSLQSCLEQVVKQIGIENKRESRWILNTGEESDQNEIPLQKSSSNGKNETELNEYREGNPRTNVFDPKSLHIGGKVKSKHRSSFWSFRK